jgi:hypothetical protein
MLVFRVRCFQYFLLVSPQEWLGRLDLNRWILEAPNRPLLRQMMVAQKAILRASAPQGKIFRRPKMLVSTPSFAAKFLALQASCA